MQKFNPLVGGGLYNMRDLYGNMGGSSTTEETAPEVTEQGALTNMDTPATAPAKNKSLWIWAAVIIGIFVFLHFGKG